MKISESGSLSSKVKWEWNITPKRFQVHRSLCPYSSDARSPLSQSFKSEFQDRPYYYIPHPPRQSELTVSMTQLLNDPPSQWATVSATCQHTDLKTSLWPTLAGRFIEELYCFIDARGESIVSLRRDWSQFHLDRSIQGVFKVFPFHW